MTTLRTSLLLAILGLGLVATEPATAAPPRREPKTEQRRERGEPKSPAQRYTIEQATSDKAQLHTIAFSGLAFLTGDFGASTFIPPGKVCDFFGFQYMRDIDATEKGHNPMFLNRVVGNVFNILTDEQEAAFSALAEKQAPALEELARRRLPLIKAFHLQADGKIPAGGSSLNRAAVERHVGGIFEADALLSLERAEAMAKVWRSLSAEQRTAFSQMKFGDFNSWPALDERDQMRQRGRGKSQLYNVAYMTYASEFFSWTAGSVEADTYFCPERHGTYFGGFFMKDMPAMGKRDFNISTTLTGDSGRDFLESILTPAQRAQIEAVVERGRPVLKEIVAVRREMATELRKSLAGGTPDRERVRALGRRYGELDGALSWDEAMAFARINQSLSAEQRQAMRKLRNLEGYPSAPYYIYSRGSESGLPNLDVAPFFVAETAQP